MMLSSIWVRASPLSFVQRLHRPLEEPTGSFCLRELRFLVPIWDVLFISS